MKPRFSTSSVVAALDALRAIENQLRAAGDSLPQDTVGAWYSAYDAYRAACTSALRYTQPDAETRALLLSPGSLKRVYEGHETRAYWTRKASA